MSCSSKLKSGCGISQYLGITYKLDQSKNFEGFLYGIGVGKNVCHKANNLKPSVTLTRKGRKYTLTTTYSPQRTHKITFDLGKTVTKELKSGSVATSVFFITGNKLEETQTTEEGIITVTRTFRPEHLIVEMSAKREKCQKFYVRVPKPDDEDVRTETSRRSIQSVYSENSITDSETEF